MDATELSKLSFFEGFDQAALERIAALGEPVDVEAGATVIEQGDVGLEAFVVRSGELQVSVSGQAVATAGPGSIVGEMALIDRRPRSASVTALTDSVVISYDAKQFQAIVDELPAAARSRLAEANARFREANADVTGAGRSRRIGG